MDNFDIEAQTVQVFTCADGEKFNSLEDAKAHTAKLKATAAEAKAAAEMEKALDSYLNDVGFIGRNRVQKHTIIKAFLVWQQTWDGEHIEAKVVDTPTPEPEHKPEELAVEVMGQVVEGFSIDVDMTGVPFDAPMSEIPVDFDVVNPDESEEEAFEPLEEVEMSVAVEQEAAEDPYYIPGVEF